MTIENKKIVKNYLEAIGEGGYNLTFVKAVIQMVNEVDFRKFNAIYPLFAYDKIGHINMIQKP